MKLALIAAALPLFKVVSAFPSGGWKSGNNFDTLFFDATYDLIATPDQVVTNTSMPAPGEPGAKGRFRYGINVASQTICYHIELWGVTGDYQSPARTATHIHEAMKGKSGPPRIAFPNPVGDERYRKSRGCLTGPFKTGVLANGTDTGDGFILNKIVANPSIFFTDSHTKKYVPGVVRGQLSKGRGC
ncbi:hypothetical protein H072_8243 [Dactylellina haptotyla CBS 200.50]|uniref:CHRD domain-containing protein n=1 Tax=Dactylellina haptotyla (strain CBS 200.50) TaxID=1284197 RepID=S8BS09_DACHA|nr:hypothetical protein H072_8243 [Dactylellina haptotyla CBS 200.50]